MDAAYIGPILGLSLLGSCDSKTNDVWVAVLVLLKLTRSGTITLEKVPDTIFQPPSKYSGDEVKERFRVCVDVVIGIRDHLLTGVTAKSDDGRWTGTTKTVYKALLIDAWNGMAEDQKIKLSFSAMLDALLNRSQ